MSDSPGSDARLLPNSISKSANLTVPSATAQTAGLGVGALQPRQPIRRATSSRLSPATRRRTRAPASRSAIKRTIGSGCAASIAAASVIGSLIGHSARRGQQQQPKNFATDYPGRAPCSPVLLWGSEGPTGAGGAG